MKGRSELWTEEETQAALRMKEAGASHATIAYAFGRTTGAVHARFKFIRLSPEEKAARHKKYHVKVSERRKQEKACASGLVVRFVNRPTVEMIAERDERFSKPRSFAQLYLGDPLPGQSALDKRNQEACYG